MSRAPSSSRPWLASEAGGGARKFAPATLRNRVAIAEVLRDWLPSEGLALELASGSGEHAAYFADRFPELMWQPSDYEAPALASIEAWATTVGLMNILPPLLIDATNDEWPIERADAVICINMCHIAPWAATEGAVHGAARLLQQGNSLIFYGPFVQRDVETAQSNVDFDAVLRARNSEWGLRSVENVIEVARHSHFELGRIVQMPANNLVVTFRRL